MLSDYNVERQTSESKGDLAYLVADVLIRPGEENTNSILSHLYHTISTLPHGISTRLIQ